MFLEVQRLCALSCPDRFLPALNYQQYIKNEPGNPFSKLIDILYYDEKTQIL